MAGRPTGSKNLPKITRFLDVEDIEKTVKTIREMALVKKDPQMLKFLAEQIFGKAPQNIDLGGNLDLKVFFDGIFKTTSKAKGNNKK